MFKRKSIDETMHRRKYVQTKKKQKKKCWTKICTDEKCTDEKKIIDEKNDQRTKCTDEKLSGHVDQDIDIHLGPWLVVRYLSPWLVPSKYQGDNTIRPPPLQPFYNSGTTGQITTNEAPFELEDAISLAVSKMVTSGDLS